MALDRNAVLDALRNVRDKNHGKDIASLGMVAGIIIRGGRIGFQIDIGPGRDPAEYEGLRCEAEQAVMRLPGVESATVVLTAEHEPMKPETPPAMPAPNRVPSRAPNREIPEGIQQIGAVIAVASGKGGVGKSTVAVNLALALAATGRKIGLLDADIYGPSVPRLVGLADRKPEVENRRIKPLLAHGISTMSIGYLVEEEKAMIWRGPMVASAIGQLLGDVDWGELDILVIDMPPGTGDAQLTLAQRAGLSGAVIVSTPQDIALIDARKGIEMFRKTDVPVLGIIENMSYFHCPKCGERAEIFGHGGARETASSLGVPFLGELPLHGRIRAFSDAGNPIVTAEPDSDEAKAFRMIAKGLLSRLDAERAAVAKQ